MTLRWSMYQEDERGWHVLGGERIITYEIDDHDLSEAISVKNPLDTLRQLFSIRQFRGKSYTLTKWQKIIIGLSLFQALFLLIINIVLLVMEEDRCASGDCRRETNLFYSISLFIMTTFTVYYAYSANMSYNDYEQIAYLINSIMITIYIIFQIHERQKDAFVALISLWVPTFLLSLVISCKVVKEIGVQRFMISLEGNEPRNVWKMRQAFYTSIKFDLMIGLIMVTMSGIYFFYNEDAEFALTVIAFFVTFVWIGLGIVAVSSRNSHLYISYILAGLLEPTYIIYKCYSLRNEPEFPYELFVTAGIFGLLVRIGLLVVSHAARSRWLQYEDDKIRKMQNVPLEPGENALALSRQSSDI